MGMSSHDLRSVEGLPLDPESARRVEIACSCTDSDLIPKIADAGLVFTDGNVRYQLMHNGLKIVEGCYYGGWTTEIIRRLKGHHEPQEEKVFHEVLRHLEPDATMVELGSFWAYYSLWFQSEIKNAKNYLIEPDPNNLEVGRRNFALNSAKGFFLQASVGKQPLEARPFLCESDSMARPVPEISIDSFVSSLGLQKIDLLLSDVQGA